MAELTGNVRGEVATALQGLYIAYFNRPADPDGLAYWSDVLAKGAGSLSDVSAAFAASSEYKASFAGLNATAVVGQIYHNLFGRPAEAAGLAYWAGLLDAGKLSINSIVKNIADGALGSDQQVFANKTALATAFSSALDTPAEQAAYARPDGALHATLLLGSISDHAMIPAALHAQTVDAAITGMLAPRLNETLGTGVDALQGGAGNDMFGAPFPGGINTLQSGDRIADAGGRADQLVAILSNASGPVVADTVGIETVTISAIAEPGRQNAVLIDAERMVGVTRWESYRSSASLNIEDVRLASNQALEDSTIVMRETDAGDVDLSVYVNAGSLESQAAASHVLRLYLRNIDSDADTDVLKTLYNGVEFLYDGVMRKVQSASIGAARSYEALASAFRDTMAGVPGLEDIVVSLGKPFQVDNSLLSTKVTGTEILFTSPAGHLLNSHSAGTGWLAAGLSSWQTYTNMSSLDVARAPVSLNVILDDVGRGGIGGDLVVATTSVPASYVGVQRLLIEVQDNSGLQTIGGGVQLSEVFLANGISNSAAGSGHVQNQGSLAVMGGNGSVTTTGIPGAHSKGMGFSELRVLDASAMSGKFSYTAEISDVSLARYSATSAQIDLRYLGGSNDDSMDITISGNVLASNAEKRPGGDYSFRAEGGAGNDQIRVAVTEGKAGWVEQQRGFANVAIDGGAGDDTIRVSGAGDSRIAGGAGNDAIVLANATSGRDTVVFAGQFGSDVLSSFQAGTGAAADRLDFSALGGNGSAFAGAAVSNSDHAITVQLLGNTNNTAARVAALYIDGAIASSHVFVAYDGANVGQVYSVSDSAAGAVVATLVGSIDLGATSWATLTGANFA